MMVLKPLMVVLLCVTAALSCNAFAQDRERDRDRDDRDRQRAAERVAERAERAAERAERDAVRERERSERDRAREAEDLAEAIERAEREAADLTEDLADADMDNSGSGSSDEDDQDNSGPGSDDDEDDGTDDDDRESENRPDEELRRDFSGALIEVDDRGQLFLAREIVIVGSEENTVRQAEILGITIIERRTLSQPGRSVFRLGVPEGQTLEDMLDRLRASEPELSSERNYLYRPSGLQSTAPAALYLGSIELPVEVAVIDGFSQSSIPMANVDRLSRSPAFSPHGNHVVAILIASMAQAADSRPTALLALDVVDLTSVGPAADTLALIAALDRCLAEQVDVVNISLAGPDHPAVRAIVSELIYSGQTIIASVGNGGPAAPMTYPAGYDGVVGVGAVDKNGKPYFYSASGAHVDFLALGVEVPITEEILVTGTSFATPVVTALAAVLRNRDKGSAYDALKLLARDAGAPGRDPIYGDGILSLESGRLMAKHSENKTR